MIRRMIDRALEGLDAKPEPDLVPWFAPLLIIGAGFVLFLVGYFSGLGEPMV